MTRLIFTLSLGSASTSEEVELPDGATEEDIEEALADWREEQTEVSWQKNEEEE